MEKKRACHPQCCLLYSTRELTTNGLGDKLKRFDSCLNAVNVALDTYNAQHEMHMVKVEKVCMQELLRDKNRQELNHHLYHHHHHHQLYHHHHHHHHRRRRCHYHIIIIIVVIIITIINYHLITYYYLDIYYYLIIRLLFIHYNSGNDCPLYTFQYALLVAIILVGHAAVFGSLVLGGVSTIVTE